MMTVKQQLCYHQFFSFVFVTIIIIAAQSDCSIRKKRIVGGWYAAQPPEDDPVRARAIHLDGEYNATQWGPPCPQEYNGRIIGSEDCLYLNVFTPQLPNTEDGYPVLIWIHGGGFKVGAACQYEMRNLIKKKLIVVSIQYRLGSLGFLSIGGAELPGNNGMFDMLLAVNWVKQYIKYFGGNPEKVVAFGHGTGAAAALMLSLSGLTNNYFSGLIAMSGSLLSNFVFDKEPITLTKTIATNHGCPFDNITNMIHCLQQLPIDTIINADSKFANTRLVAEGFLSGISALLVPGPVIEGFDDLRSLPNFMVNTPENFLSHGKFPSIPLLIGVMKNEAGGAISGGYSNEILKNIRTTENYMKMKKKLLINLQETIPIFENTSKQFILEAFDKYLNNDGDLGMKLKDIAKAINDAIFNVPAFLTANYWGKKAKTFFYSFDHVTKKSRKNNFLHGLPIVDAENSQNITDSNEGHGDDLNYIFDQNDIFGNKIEKNKNENDTDHERVSDVFTNMISQFVEHGLVGDFSQSELNKSSFNDNSGNIYLSITDKLKPVKQFKFCEMALWTGAIDQLSSSFCDNLRVTIETVERVTANTKKIVNLVGSSIDPIGNLQGIDKKVIPVVNSEIEDKIKIINPNISYVPKIPKFG
ncbi:hypothetical protein PV327_009356 [Microctonus hyperodae]|uniref:Carboxylesterase type B domain-containing protein n=1 Tax=Microctonus hyperodae TaxID=165561 RepID=A0AA39KVZ2_MICHY|nr:hypothetical protein PV327_009356 [Microctonus hyperodae]